mmetsp:Transcript_6504/g.16914  ORF Transcript_6504/g.16914 Transcript_6504/m.16914 type:complete len:248 (+) Transcript_6504:176-919(+)
MPAPVARESTSATIACACALKALPSQLCGLAAALVPGLGSAPAGGADQKEPPQKAGSRKPPSSSSTTAIVCQPNLRAGTTSPWHESPTKTISWPEHPNNFSSASAEPPASMCVHGSPGASTTSPSAELAMPVPTWCAHSTERSGLGFANQPGFFALATIMSQHACSANSPKAAAIVKRAKSAAELVTITTRKPRARTRMSQSATRGRGGRYLPGSARSALKKPPVSAAKAGCWKQLIMAAKTSSWMQ